MYSNKKKTPPLALFYNFFVSQHKNENEKIPRRRLRFYDFGSLNWLRRLKWWVVDGVALILGRII